MSSRRKQSKPKAVANPELELNGVTTTVNTDTIVTEPIEQKYDNQAEPVVYESGQESEVEIVSNQLKRKRSMDHIEEQQEPESDDQTATEPDAYNQAETEEQDEIDADIPEEGTDQQIDDNPIDQDPEMIDDDEEDDEEDDEDLDDDLLPDSSQIDSSMNHTQNYLSMTMNGDNDIKRENLDQFGIALGNNCYQCKVCGKGFKHRRSLNRHVKLHSGEKNFKCQYCSTAFARSDHLKAHIRTHNNSKPHRCSICQCGYNTQAALKVHIAHHHSKSKFKCVLCNNLEFHSQLALEGHMYTKHSGNDSNTDIKENNEQVVQNGTSFSQEYMNPDVKRIRLSDINNLNDSDAKKLNDEFITDNCDMFTGDEQSQKDIKLEPNASINKLKKIAPKTVTTTVATALTTTSSSTTTTPISASNTQNTFCDICQVRFSSFDSYISHMRNCHPKIPPPAPAVPQPSAQSQNSSVKMPYLTSILRSGNLSGANETPIAKIAPKPAITVPNNQVRPSNTQNFSSQQQVPTTYSNLNMLNNTTDDYYIIKETHYSCAHCNLTYFKLNDYMQHLKHEHCVEVFRCILCKQMQLFDNLNLLKEHFFTVHQSHKYDLYKCKLCLNSNQQASGSSNQIIYNNLNDLLAHLKTVHNHAGPAPVSPAQANNYSSAQIPPVQTFNTAYPPAAPPPPPPQPLYTNNGKCFKCTYCDSDFAQQYSLNQHIQMVHKNVSQPVVAKPEQFSCQYCRNTFSTRVQLERHVRIHVSSIDLKCNICDAQFDTQDLLAQHKLTHCKTFQNPPAVKPDYETKKELAENPAANNINNNNQISSNQSAICVYCKQEIDNELQFKEHFKKHNNIGTPQQRQQQQQNGKSNCYNCIVCRQTLTSNNEYNLHMKHHLRKSNNKSPAVSTAPQPAALNRAIFKCVHCPIKFESNQDLSDHMSKQHSFQSASSSPLSSMSSSSSTTSSSSSVKDERRSPPQQIQQQPQQTISNPPSDHLCEICSSKFDSQQKLQAHLLLKHEFSNQSNSNGQIYNVCLTCPVCDESFSRADYLLSHTQVHGQAAKIYKCTQCPMAFVFKSQLINHSFSHQQQKQSSGNMGLNECYNLRSSPVRNGQQAPLVTNSANNNNIRRNPMQQSSQAPITNNIQNKTPTQNNQQRPVINQINSMETSTPNGAIKTYTCPTCSKTFANYRNLTVHIRIHTGFRPYECDVCKRKFTRRENLRSHMKCHLNLRPFTCSICSRSFRRKSHVVSHIEVHLKSKLHNCIECSFQFDQLETFLRHIIKDHSLYDRELINLIKQKNIIDLSEFNIDYAALNNSCNVKSNGQNGNGDNSSDLTLQSLIDQSLNGQSLNEDGYGDEDDYGEDDQNGDAEEFDDYDDGYDNDGYTNGQENEDCINYEDNDNLIDDNNDEIEDENDPNLVY